LNEISDLNQWIEALGVPQEKLGGHSVCPFAKLASRFTMIRVNGEIIPPEDRNFDIIIYLLPAEISFESMNDLCVDLNAKYTDLIFLPDHKDRHTTINGVQTNNGKHNILLCQPKQKLKDARAALRKTNYYTYWEDSYLREILGEDYGNLD
jgi:multidrug efflux pump subunit AcrB